MGKASLVYVIGLSMIISYGLFNINAAGTDAVDNYSTYYGRTLAHEIASSGANIGCADVFLNPSYNTSYTDVDFHGGTLNIDFVESGNSKFVRSVGEFEVNHSTIVDTITVELRNQSLARYAWFTNIEADMGGQVCSWSTGDTAWGPAHTNDKFNINGSPAFMKKATAWQSAVPVKNNAYWGGGWEWGIKIPYPTNLDPFINAATDPSYGRAVVNTDAYLTFNPSGSVELNVPWQSIDTTFPSAQVFSQNGAFAVIGGNLYVQGTLSGDLAIGAVSKSGIGGNVYITGDVRYSSDPRVNPSSTDRLAILAEHNIQVTYDNSNASAYYNRHVDASIFSLKGDFEVQDAKKWPPRGTLYTFGAMMQYYRGDIGKVVGITLQNGYSKNFRYDDRLALNPPKYYPSTGRYLMFAWRED